MKLVIFGVLLIFCVSFLRADLKEGENNDESDESRSIKITGNIIL